MWDSITVMRRSVKAYYAGAEPAPTALGFIKMNKEKDKYITRYCKHHGDVKFILEGRGYYRCTKCRMDAVSRKRKKLKKDLVNYKGGKCEKCGYDKCVAAMDFHHINPKEKNFGIGQNGNTNSIEKLKKEVDKCLLLCANCHRELHDQLNGFKDKLPARKLKVSNKCKTCGLGTNNKKYCSNKCCKLDNRKVERPSKEELITILSAHNWSSAGRKFGVSDNAIRKWAKQYGINTNRKEL